MLFELLTEIGNVLSSLLVLDSESVFDSVPSLIDLAEPTFVDFLLILENLHLISILKYKF